MLAKKYRLRSNKDFRLLSRSRQVARGTYLTARLAAAAEKEVIGFVVSKAVSKKAVDRNKLKRRLRNIAAKNGWPKGYCTMVITHKPAVGLNYSQLEHEYNKTIAAALARRHNRPRH